MGRRVVEHRLALRQIYHGGPPSRARRPCPQCPATPPSAVACAGQPCTRDGNTPRVACGAGVSRLPRPRQRPSTCRCRPPGLQPWLGHITTRGCPECVEAIGLARTAVGHTVYELRRCIACRAPCCCTHAPSHGTRCPPPASTVSARAPCGPRCDRRRARRLISREHGGARAYSMLHVAVLADGHPRSHAHSVISGVQMAP